PRAEQLRLAGDCLRAQRRRQKDHARKNGIRFPQVHSPSARPAQALRSATSVSKGTRWIRVAQARGMKRAVMAKMPWRMSGQPCLRNTSYVDGQFVKIDQTRVRGVIR